MKTKQKSLRTIRVSMFSLTASMILAEADQNQQRGKRSAAALPRTVDRSHSPNRHGHSHPNGNRGNTIEVRAEARTVNGTQNNLKNPTWGAAQETTIRIFENAYSDGVSSPAGEDRPSARAVSNAVIAQSESTPNARGASDYLWQWGQFIDHDIVETPSADPAEAFDILVPTGDVSFDPFNTGIATIPLNRSFYEEHEGVREQVNEISAYLDASMVYGSDDTRAFTLRTLDGTGKLKITESDVHGALLPYNETGLPNAGGTSSALFLAGDVRANEQAGLTAMHTLFVREHNYWAEEYAEKNPIAAGEEIYQFARMVVAAEVQSITYNEFLPVLLGDHAMPRYRGYNSGTQADISNSFGAAAFRLGHSMLSSNLLRIEADGSESTAGHLSLADSFFTPSLIEDEGIESILRGLATQQCQELDAHLIDEVRNFLFGPPGAGGFDLASLNIQRGRDHGIPNYNSARVALGLSSIDSMADLVDHTPNADALASVYDSPDQIDLWVGGLCETDVAGSMVGPTLQAILVDQFTRLRDGDRFYYKTMFSDNMVELIEEQTLSVIIKRNTEIGDELRDDVFTMDVEAPEVIPTRSRRTRSSQRRSSRRNLNSKR